MTRRKVPTVVVRTKGEVSDELARDWLRLAPQGERGLFAARIGLGENSHKVVSRAISGEGVPELHNVLNSLVVDPSALLNTLLLWGVVAVPVETQPVDDMAVVCNMFKAATEYLERMQDGTRDHRDTAALAKLFRPLVPQMLALIREANGGDRAELRAVA
jgi:hypothetical protein